MQFKFLETRYEIVVIDAVEMDTSTIHANRYRIPWTPGHHSTTSSSNSTPCGTPA